MKQCADCRRRGLLLRLDAFGRCVECTRRLEKRLERRVGKARSALAAADAILDVDGVIEELGRAALECRELERLERATQRRVSPRTEILSRAVVERRNRVLCRWAESVTSATMRQLERLESREQREVLLYEALRRLQRHQDKVSHPGRYQECQRRLSSRLLGVQGEQAVLELESVPELPLVDAARPTPTGRPAPPVAAAVHATDRRRAERRSRRFYVTLSPGGDRCLAADVSASGIKLHGSQPQQVGDFLDLQLHTAKGPYRATGMVVWTLAARAAPDLPDANAIGVAFTGGVPVAAA